MEIKQNNEIKKKHLNEIYSKFNHFLLTLYNQFSKKKKNLSMSLLCVIQTSVERCHVAFDVHKMASHENYLDRLTEVNVLTIPLLCCFTFRFLSSISVLCIYLYSLRIKERKKNRITHKRLLSSFNQKLVIRVYENSIQRLNIKIAFWHNRS